MSGLYSLATIIKRLEAVTSRLEDATHYYERTNPQALEAPPPPPPPQQLLPPPPPPPPPPPVELQVPTSVLAYDNDIFHACVTPFVELTKSFASDSCVSMINLFEGQMKSVRDLVLLSANCRKPQQEELVNLIEALNRGVEDMGNARSGNKKERDWAAHLAFVAEGGPVVGWVQTSKPAIYVGDVKEVVDYYGNKIIKDYKEKDTKHVDWVRSFIKILDETRNYVQQYHPTGLAWNPKGVSIQEFRSSQEAKAATSLPPPPPPPPPPPAAPATPAASSATSVAAVFADLNRGEEVTKGLRKVDRSEMTHKNPSLRAGSTVPPGRKPIKPSKPQALAGKKPSKFALEGNKWLVEYHENTDPLTIDNVEINQVVNIFACKNIIVIIKGKVNAVTLVNCIKTSVLVDSVVSSISVTRSPSFQLQVKGMVPMIQLDSTDSGQIYLPPGSLGAEILTAKCSAINVNLPVDGEEEGVFAEQAIPEMLKTVIQDGKVVTSIVEHVG